MRLDTYLREHHQIVDLAALTSLGHSVELAYAHVTARRWQRVHPAVFCGYTGPLTFGSHAEAALCHAGPGAALDAATAAAVHGLPGFESSTIEVVIPHGRRVDSRPALVVRRSRTLTGRSVQVRGGLRIVRVERAVLSLALTRPGRAAGIVTSAVQQGLTTPDRLRGCLLGLGGVRNRRAVLAAIDDADGGSRSWLESRFWQLVVEDGLPAPVRNHPLLVEGRRLWLDACYVAERIAIELDGRAYHVMSEDWEDDLSRQNAIVLDGWLVLRFTARDLRERPEAVVASVRRALSLWGRSVAS